MPLQTPQQKDSVAQLLYALAVRTGVHLSLDKLGTIVCAVGWRSSDPGDTPRAELLELQISIDLSDRERLKASAKRVHALAEELEAAADRMDAPR